MKIFGNLFKTKRQGKDFLDNWDLNEKQKHTVKRTAALGASGAGTGAVIGAAAGGLKAWSDISKVPYQEVTVQHEEGVFQRELMGHIPPDDYVRGSWRPSDDGVPTEAVYRDNPKYFRSGNPETRPTSTTFRGRGEPQPVEWNTEKIYHHNMNESNPYTYRAVEDNERYLSHYETVSKSRQVPYSDTESYQDCATSYNSDGSSSYDCDTRTRSVTRYRTEYYTEEEPVYRWRTVGHWQKYSENIQSRVVGSVQKPTVRFDHGVDVGGYMLKGLLYGAAIGAVAGGVAAAMEEKYFPDVLPGYTPKPQDPVKPTPPNGEDPVKPTPPKPEPPKPEPPKPEPPKPEPPKPKPDCGGYRRHTHDDADFRHSHAGADRWHYHGCPDTGVFDENIICFKPSQVPDCYKDEDPLKSCDSNGSVCYTMRK